jgi:glycerophosphoryl diester phosphodiesterase
MDAKLTADQQVVIHHDLTLDRTTDGKGRVSSYKLSELKRLDAGSKFDIQYKDEPIPTLEEVFEAIGDRLLYNIELTNYSTPFDKLPEIVLRIICEYGVQAKVLISSFNPFALMKVNKIQPDIVTGLLIKSTEPKWMRNVFRLLAKHDAIHPDFGLLEDRYVIKSLNSNKLVNVWTVNERKEIIELLDLGVNGIITDDPELVRNVMMKKVATI